MIPSANKFPLRTEFLRFRVRAKRSVTPHSTIYYLRSTTLPRLSIVVPKKLSKLSSTRNWLKRLTYDTIWGLIQAKNLDCVVVYKPLPLKKSPTISKELIDELTQALGNC